MVDVINIVAQTVISTTQIVAQGLSAYQIISVTCDIETCDKCKKDHEEIVQICDHICNCKLQNIDLKQHMKCNFSNLLLIENDVFVNTFIDNLCVAISEKQQHVDTTELKELHTKTITNIFTELQSNSMQTALQSLAVTQVITLKSGGIITGVNMVTMVDMVSTILMRSENITKLTTKLTVDLETIIKIVQAGLNQVIIAIIEIICCVAIITIFIYCISLMFQLGFAL